MTYLPRFSISYLLRVAIGLCIYLPISKGLSTKCVFVDECEFYAWYVYTGNNGIPDSPEETVEAFLKEQGCGVDKDGNVVKGRNTINLILFSSRKK